MTKGDHHLSLSHPNFSKNFGIGLTPYQDTLKLEIEGIENKQLADLRE